MAAGASFRISAHGVTAVVPPGWEAEIAEQEDPALTDTNLETETEPRVVLHMANFALPPDRGDYGSGAVETMGRGGIFISLLEFDETSGRSPLFGTTRIPSRLQPDELSTDQLQRPLPGQAGTQRFFQVTRAGRAPRAFCLYVVIGSHTRRRILTSEANRALSGLSIS